MRHTRKDISPPKLKYLYVERKLSLIKISKILGFSSRTIELRAKECGVLLRKPGREGPAISDVTLRDLYLKKHLSSRKIAKIFNCAYSYVDTKIRKLGLPIKTLAAAHITTKRSSFSENLNEKAYLIGFKIGDLRVRKVYKNSETILVDCGSTKSEQIRLIETLFEKYGRVWISKPKSDNKVQIECGLNESFSFLLKKYSKFPAWVLDSEEIKLSAIAGFIDAEGSFYLVGDSLSSGFAIGNYNQTILKQIMGWIRNYGFKVRYFKGVKKGYTGKDGYKHNNDYWILSIGAKRDLFLFTKKILPYLKHKDRIKCAKLVLRNITERNRKYGFIGM